MEAFEELVVVRASSSKKLLGDLLCTPLFERVRGGAHLLHLILYPSLLCLDLVTVLAGHGLGALAQQFSHVALAPTVRRGKIQLRAVACGSA